MMLEVALVHYSQYHSKVYFSSKIFTLKIFTKYVFGCWRIHIDTARFAKDISTSGSCTSYIAHLAQIASAHLWNSLCREQLYQTNCNGIVTLLYTKRWSVTFRQTKEKPSVTSMNFQFFPLYDNWQKECVDCTVFPGPKSTNKQRHSCSQQTMVQVTSQYRNGT